MKQKLYLIMNNNYFPYALIGLTIVLFNLIAVFGLNVLLLDDNARYLSVVQDEFPIHILYRSFLGAVFFEWYAYKIMFYSPELIRFLYVIVYMIPVSWVVYRITNHHLGISKNVSITLSILPNIIPKQLFIPAFINGSYPVYGLLITLIAFLLGLQYLKNENKRSYVYLIISVIVFYIAGLTFAEYIVFLFPPLVFFILFYGSNMKKKILLSLLYLPIVLLKIYLTLFGFKAGANQPIQLSLNEILNRIYLYFEWAVPFSIEKIFFPSLIILICIIGAGFIHLFYKGSSIKRPQLFNNLSHYCPE